MAEKEFKIIIPANTVQQRLAAFFTIILHFLFGSFAAKIISLRQFFKHLLSRKAEGNGPLKP
jgi:hypothetical protein